MLVDLLQRVNELKAELDAVRPLSTEDAQRLRAKLNLEWNYHSNAIEGNTLTLGETRAFLYHGITARGKPFKDYLDIKGHKAAIEHIEAIVREEHPLTEADIRQLHELLLVEPYEMDALTPDGQPTKRMIQVGEYKSMPNSVRTSTGELHSYASPEETPALMGDLMTWYRKEMDNAESHPVVIAALFHHRFVSIHPFDDGNGRMTRILMNLILMRAGYVPVVIKNEQRDAYILALSQADAGEAGPFVEFIAGLEIEQLALTLKAARGESIDEPDDLDKRLSLLDRQLNGRAKEENLNVELASSGFILPFIAQLSNQLPKFNRFFRKNDISLSVAFSDIDQDAYDELFRFEETYSGYENIDDIPSMPFTHEKSSSEYIQIVNSKQILDTVKENLQQVDRIPIAIRFMYRLLEFKIPPHRDLYLEIVFRLDHEAMLLCKWNVLDEPDGYHSHIHQLLSSKTLVKSPYQSLNFSEKEINAKVKIITDEIYRRIEEFSGLNN